MDRAIAEGKDPLAIVNECRVGMELVGDLYSTGEYFLSELIMSADIFKKVMEKVEPLLVGTRRWIPGGGRNRHAQGRHSRIGKNIVATLMKIAGFEVQIWGWTCP